MDPWVDWHQDLSPDAPDEPAGAHMTTDGDTTGADLQGWSLEQLDELALAVFADVDGVEIVEDDLGDENPAHGANDPGEQVLPPPPAGDA